LHPTLHYLVEGGKIAKINSAMEEANAMQHLTHCYSDGQMKNIPWLLTEQESDVLK